MRRHVNELTFFEILDLRSQIVLNSVFLNDYENNMGVDPREVMNFFDGYVDYLEEIRKDECGSCWEDYDNQYTLKDWYNIYQ